MDLDLGLLSATDDGEALTFEIVEDYEDYYAFAIDEAGVLFFDVQPDFETKPTYKVVVKVTDDGGKETSKTFEIKVTDDGITPAVNISVSYAESALGDPKLWDAQDDLDFGSETSVEYAEKLNEFDAWLLIFEEEVDVTLAYFEELDLFALDLFEATSSGVTLTDGDGYQIIWEYAGSAPSNLASLQSTLNAASTWDDIQLSGGFSKLNFVNDEGVSFAQLQHTAQGMKLVNPYVDGLFVTEVKSFTLDGDFSNQIYDFVNVFDSFEFLLDPEAIALPDEDLINEFKAQYDLEGLSFQDADGDFFAFRENDARTGLEIIYEDHKIDILTDAFSESTDALFMEDFIPSIIGDLTLDTALYEYADQTQDPDLHLEYSYNGETLITIDTDGVSLNEIIGETGIVADDIWYVEDLLWGREFWVGDDTDGNVVAYEQTDTVAFTVTDITLEDYMTLQAEFLL